MQIFHPSLFKPQVLYILSNIEIFNFYSIFNLQKPNPCEKSKCSDICLLAPKKNNNSKGYTCACPDDKLLSAEGSFCSDITIPSTLIVGASTIILEIEQEHLGRQKIKEIPLKNYISRITAITYNSLSGTQHTFLLVGSIVSNC